MILTAIITGLILFLGNLALFFVVRRRLKVGLSDYFTPQGENPSEIDQWIDIHTTRVAQKTAQSLKAAFMGIQSGEAKNTKKVEGAIAQDLMSQQSPMLAAIAQSFPALNKLVMGNPALIPIAQKFLAQKSGSDQGGLSPDTAGGSSDNGSSFEAELSKLN